jgi:hypothetical protein
MRTVQACRGCKPTQQGKHYTPDCVHGNYKYKALKRQCQFNDIKNKAGRLRKETTGFESLT